MGSVVGEGHLGTSRAQGKLLRPKGVGERPAQSAEFGS